MNLQKPIELTKTFVRDEISGRESQVPHPKSFREWTHLQRVADLIPRPMEDTKVGLLVGTNCTQAVEPKDFVASENGGPFTVLTFLTFAGWTVVGPCCSCLKMCLNLIVIELLFTK